MSWIQFKVLEMKTTCRISVRSRHSHYLRMDYWGEIRDCTSSVLDQKCLFRHQGESEEEDGAILHQTFPGHFYSWLGTSSSMISGNDGGLFSENWDVLRQNLKQGVPNLKMRHPTSLLQPSSQFSAPWGFQSLWQVLQCSGNQFFLTFKSHSILATVSLSSPSQECFCTEVPEGKSSPELVQSLLPYQIKKTGSKTWEDTHRSTNFLTLESGLNLEDEGQSLKRSINQEGFIIQKLDLVLQVVCLQFQAHVN